MCGIAGKIYFEGKEIDRSKELVLIQKTLQNLQHRGPDDQGFIIEKNVWLGATRLSIVDLSFAGHQPMHNEDKSLFLVFNGEIYNYQEIKRRLTKRHKFISETDAEVLLHLYEEKGRKCLEYLRGMFAFALWDSQKRELFLARDRIGKKPLKYYFNDKFFVFASELKAFIDYQDIPKEIDWEAVDEFLTYQYVLPPKTGFKNIWKLPPAHYMVVSTDGKINIKRYWQIDFSQKLNLKEKEWEKRIENKLHESVKLRLQSDVSLGVHLSGGIDSGLITAVASLESKNKIKTFSIGFEESDYNELPYARLIAQKYHTDHHEVVVKANIIELLPKLIFQYEEPFADPSILPSWLLMKESKKYFTVVLNGDGGDENFAGYRRYQVMKLFHLLKIIPAKKYLSSLLYLIYRYYPHKDIAQMAKIFEFFCSNYQLFYQELMSFLGRNIRNKLYSDDFRQKIEKAEKSSFLLDKFQEIKKGDWLDKLLYVDINSYLPGVLLAKSDITSMSFSLEARSPFLDHEFLELTAWMPSYFKLKGFQTKYILKKIAKKYLPKECFERSKQGFVPPLFSWFREKYPGYIKSQLMDKKFIHYGLFEKNILEELVSSHVTGKKNNAYLLWSLLVLKNWLEIWFD